MEQEKLTKALADLGAIGALALAGLSIILIIGIMASSPNPLFLEEGRGMVSFLMLYALAMIYSVAMFKDTSAKPLGFIRASIAQEFSRVSGKWSAVFSKEALIVGNSEILLFPNIKGIGHLLTEPERRSVLELTKAERQSQLCQMNG